MHWIYNLNAIDLVPGPLQINTDLAFCLIFGQRLLNFHLIKVNLCYSNIYKDRNNGFAAHYTFIKKKKKKHPTKIFVIFSWNL